MGASGGDYLAAGLQDNVDDARAALRSLVGQPECAGSPVFGIGHSEGSMIVTVLAGEAGEAGNPVDEAVLLAAPGSGERLAFDPGPHLAAITVPVLAITGAKDLQVEPADLEVVAAAVAGR